MKTRSKSKALTKWKPDLSHHPDRPTVDELMAMSDEDFSAFMQKIGMTDQVLRARRARDAAV